MIHRDLHAGIAHDDVAPKYVSFHPRRYEQSVCVPKNGVFFDDVAGIAGGGKTNTKITALGRVTITN